MAAIWVAKFETPNFDFEAFGRSEESARAALAAGWTVHARQYNADPGYLVRFAEDVSCYRVFAGTCYRDKEQITT